jgi:hypothetical protein
VAYAESAREAGGEATSSPSPSQSTPAAFAFEGWFFFDTSNAYRVAGTPAHTWGYGYGAMVSARIEALRVGVFGDVAAQGVGPRSLCGGVVLGPSWAPLPWLQVDALGEIGAHDIYDIGDGLFATSGGPSTVLPFLGARLSAARRFGPGHHAVLGLSLGFREDVGQQSNATPGISCIARCSTAAQSTASKAWSIGGESWLAGVRLGFEY